MGLSNPGMSAGTPARARPEHLPLAVLAAALVGLEMAHMARYRYR